MRRWKKIALATLAALGVTAAVVYRLLYPGLTFIQRAADPAAEFAGEPFTEWEAPGVRVYQPTGGHSRVVLLIHGLHWGGYDEARMVPFARKLAGMGLAVVTPDIADLKNYRIDARAVDDIEKAALWTLDQSGLVTDGKIGVMGICFSGGLGLSAATRPALRDRVAYVFTFGSHADLDSTMKYLVSDPGAHPYGLMVMAREYADRIVPDPEPFRAAMLEMLRRDGEIDKTDHLSPKSLEYVEMCRTWKTDALRAALTPLLKPSPDALSPVRLTPPDFPVYILHGTGDTVVPASEAARLAAWAPDAEALVSDLVVHVELGHEAGWTDYWNLARFWTTILRS